MPLILSSVFSILSKVPGLVGNYFDKKQQIEKIKIDTAFETEKQRLKSIAEMAVSNNEWAGKALAATGRKFKYAVFLLISLPFISCLVGVPQYAGMVFHNLESLPVWYNIMFTTIVGVIWGTKSIPQISRNVIKYKNRKLNKKAIYDAIRKRGEVSQELVDELEPLLEEKA